MTSVTGELLLQAGDELETYWKSFDRYLGRVENVEHFHRFGRGQFGTLERKSLEPMALAEGVPPRPLQFFFSRSVWDESAMRDELQRRVQATYGGPDGVLVIDETSDAKQGEETAGVARQYCGESGKIDNCIVTVHTSYARGDFHGLLDGDLFLPECWNPDLHNEEIQIKRARTLIPENVVHESKPVLALHQLKRALGNGIQARYVTADEGYGGKPAWRDAVQELGLLYVVEVPKSTAGWVSKPPVAEPASKGRGRPVTKPRLSSSPKRLDELAGQSSGYANRKATQFVVKDTHKGPVVWTFKEGLFWESCDRGRQVASEPKRVLIGRNISTGEVKYFLSCAPSEIPMSELVHVAFHRATIERCFQDCKCELGLNHAELRSYPGIHRHLILTAINYFFLKDWTLQHREEKKTRLLCATTGGCAPGPLGAKERGPVHPTATPLLG